MRHIRVSIRHHIRRRRRIRIRTRNHRNSRISRFRHHRRLLRRLRIFRHVMGHRISDRLCMCLRRRLLILRWCRRLLLRRRVIHQLLLFSVRVGRRSPIPGRSQQHAGTDPARPGPVRSSGGRITNLGLVRIGPMFGIICWTGLDPVHH